MEDVEQETGMQRCSRKGRLDDGELIGSLPKRLMNEIPEEADTSQGSQPT
jgi:hypothetical protein